jgi:hypothetical protein
MEDRSSRSRPATRYFFEQSTDVDDHPRAVTIHRWAIANLKEQDTRDMVHRMAGIAVRDVIGMSSTITGEIVFRSACFLPQQPLSEDGQPLFSQTDSAGLARFGIPEGNLIKSTNCFLDDVKNAAHTLTLMDPELNLPHERLMLFCAKPLEKKLIRAAAKARVPCRVFGIYNYKTERSWVLTRDTSPCALVIGRPNFPLRVQGEGKIVVGARFTVWVNDPRNAVCVTA